MRNASGYWPARGLPLGGATLLGGEACIEGVVRAKEPQRLPVVLSVDEVRHLSGPAWLAACLLYGAGRRLMEALRLRVKDVEFEHRAILVRDGQGARDRAVTLPDGLIVSLRRHLEHVRLIHEKDLSDGFGAVWRPFALGRKYPQIDTHVIQRGGSTVVSPLNALLAGKGRGRVARASAARSGAWTGNGRACPLVDGAAVPGLRPVCVHESPSVVGATVWSG